jgi:hypothetical protein
VKAHWPVALAAAGIVGAMLLFMIRRQLPPHPLWFWFGVAVVFGPMLDRWSALWLAPVPSVTILSVIGWFVHWDPPSTRGDFGSDPMVVAVLISIWLAFIGLWGILIGFAGRAVLHRTAEQIRS